MKKHKNEVLLLLNDKRKRVIFKVIEDPKAKKIIKNTKLASCYEDSGFIN